MNDFMIPKINMPNLDAIQKVAQENEDVRRIALTSTAEETAKYIYNSILEFSSQIGENSEVGLQVTTLGSGIQVYLSELSYHNPHLIIFGSENPDGTKLRIVQHVTQLNYALIAMPKIEPEKPKRKIGFNVE